MSLVRISSVILGQYNTCSIKLNYYILNLVSNLIAYWKLDEASGNRLDSTSNANTLILHNTVPTATGLINSCVLGNGSGWLQTTNSLDFSRDFTINYWTIPNTDGTVQQFCGPDRNGINFNVTHDSIYYGVPDVIVNLSYYPSGGISTSNWCMATLIRKGSTISIYYNGNLVANGTDSNTGYSGNYALLAVPGGAYVANSNGAKIDEVGVWNRALTTTEIRFLYNSGAGLTFPLTVVSTSLNNSCKIISK